MTGAILILGVPVSAWAVESATITEQTQLSFAKLQRPTSGSHTLTINPTSGGYSGTGTVLTGTPTRGQYKLKKTGGGGGFSSVTIDVQNVNSGSAALTINQFKGNYEGSAINIPQSGLAKPDSGGGSTLYLGATATYTSSVPAGTLTPSFDIVVTYQ